MLLRPSLAALLGLLLLGAGPTLETTHDFLTNMAGSVAAERARLDSAVAALQETTDLIVSTAGGRDSILRLDRDAERTARAAGALALKTARLAELADQLVEAVR